MFFKHSCRPPTPLIHICDKMSLRVWKADQGAMWVSIPLPQAPQTCDLPIDLIAPYWGLSPLEHGLFSLSRRVNRHRGKIGFKPN